MKIPEELQRDLARIAQSLNDSELSVSSVVAVTKDKRTSLTPSPFAIPRERMMPIEEAVRIELFVVQYIKDFDAVRAMQRMGFIRERAIRESVRILEDPYTQKLLDSVICDIPVEQMVTESQVVAGLLREANYMGDGSNSSSRIKAWETIGKIKGMFTEKKEIAVSGTGVMEVPFAASESEWEMRSVNSQTKLKKDVTT